jgi:hypothetical protein
LALMGSAALPAVAGGAEVPGGGTVDLGAAGTRFGIASQDGRLVYGTVVRNVGDVNGDGVQDYAVAAPYTGTTEREQSGIVHVVFGRRSPVADVALPGAAADGLQIGGLPTGARAGMDVAGIGDLNGDGFGDLVVGAPWAGTLERPTAGAAYVVFGAADGGSVDLSVPGARALTITGAAQGDLAGTAVAALGDLDGDGRSEVVVGARNAGNNARPSSGSAYVLLSSGLTANVDLALPLTAGYRIDGAAVGALTGDALTGSADMTGDGRPDLIVGSPGVDRVDVVPGQTAEPVVDLAGNARSMTAPRGDGAGHAIAALGDVNGDHIPDLAIGAPNARPLGRLRAGVVHVVYGGVAAGPITLPADSATGAQITGPTGAQVGKSVAAAGDVNADGHADVLVGASGARPLGRASGGAAYVVLASPLDLTLSGRNAIRFAGAGSERLGSSVAGGADLDGDGFPDALIGGIASARLAQSPQLPPAPPEGSPWTRSCTAPVSRVAVLVGDSGSMSRSDPQNARRAALETLLATRQTGPFVLSAVAFGFSAKEVFPPLVTADANLGLLRLLVAERVGLNSGGHDLVGAFAAAAAVDPARRAQILIVDGTDADRPVPTAEQVGVPTYVIGLGVGRLSRAGLKLRRIAARSGGTFTPSVRPARLQATLASILARLACERPVVAPPVSAQGDRPITLPGQAAPGDTSVGTVSAIVPAKQPVTFATGTLRPPAGKHLVSLTLTTKCRRTNQRLVVTAVRLLRGRRVVLRIPRSVLKRAARREVSYRRIRIRVKQGRKVLKVRLSHLNSTAKHASSAPTARAASGNQNGASWSVRHGSRRPPRQAIPVETRADGRWGRN